MQLCPWPRAASATQVRASCCARRGLTCVERQPASVPIVPRHGSHMVPESSRYHVGKPSPDWPAPTCPHVDRAGAGCRSTGVSEPPTGRAPTVLVRRRTVWLDWPKIVDCRCWPRHQHHQCCCKHHACWERSGCAAAAARLAHPFACWGARSRPCVCASRLPKSLAAPPSEWQDNAAGAREWWTSGRAGSLDVHSRFRAAE